MRSPLRWLIVLVPVVVVGVIEVLSDSWLDESFTFPLDTLLVVAVVGGLSTLFALLAFRRIDALTGALDRRNAELQDRVVSARALHRVSVAMAALAEIDAVLAVVVENARTLLRADAAFLLLAEPDGGFRLRARSGPPEAFAATSVSGVRRDPGAGGTENDIERMDPGGVNKRGTFPGGAYQGRILDQGAGLDQGGSLDQGGGAEPVTATDRVGDWGTSDPLRFVRADFARAHLGAPLQRGDTTSGLLTVANRTPRSFSVDDVEVLASLANQAALALENARLQARLRELAVAGERERIAREMHDGLAQVLGYVNTKSQAIDEFLAAGRVADARSHLVELASAARSLYVDVREAILGLRSPIVGADGLVPAIETYAMRFADASKLAVEVRAGTDARALSLEPAVQANVFRIVQEGLTNVRKHAQARRARIDLEVAGGSLVLRLTDDGRGLAGNGSDPESQLGWPRYGQSAMRERAESIGGRIGWSEAPDGGTVVDLTVPVVAASAADTRRQVLS